MSRERLDQLRKKKRLAELRAKRGMVDESPQFDSEAALAGIAAGDTGLPVPDIVPTGEATLTNLTGAVAGTIAPIAGGISAAAEPVRAAVTGEYQDPLVGPRVRDQLIQMMTYQPRTARGRELIQRQAELLQPIAEGIEKTRLGQEALDAGLHPGVARIAESIPEYAGAGLAALGLRQPKPGVQVDKAGNVVSQLSKKGKIGSDLRNRPELGSTAKYKLSEAGKVISDPAGKAAVGQGWAEKTVSGVKSANAATKAKIRQMVNIAKKRTPEGDIRSEMLTRPSDVAGKSLMNRYRFVKSANRSAGKLLDKIARDTNKPVNISKPLQWFKNQLDEYGIRILPDGKVDFSGSSLPKSDYGLIRENIRQIQRTMKGQASFYNAHKLKQTLRRTGLSYEQTVAKKGASPDAQNIFKGLSGKIDEVLDGQSKAYDMQNIKFGDTRNIMNSIEKIAKDNLFTESADTQLGVLTRRLMGNPVSRGAIIDMANNIDDIARKYGGKFDDDLFTQAWVANDMDDVVKVAAGTSIKGELGAQTLTAMDRSDVGKLAHVVDKTAEYLTGKSEMKALDSLQALTR